MEIPVRKYFMLSQVVGRFLDAEEMEEKRIVVRHETYKMGLLWAFQLVNKLPADAVLSVLYSYSLVQNPSPSGEGKRLPTRFTLWDYSPSVSRADIVSCVLCFLRLYVSLPTLQPNPKMKSGVVAWRVMSRAGGVASRG